MYSKYSVALSLFLITFLTVGVGMAQKPTPAPNGVEINKDGDKGLRLFKGRFIIQQEVINPAEVAGSLLMVDNMGQPNEQATWMKVIPTKPNQDPEFQDEIVYQSIVDKGFVVNANYLVFNSSVNATDKVELIVQDVMRFKADPFTAAGVRDAATLLVAQNPRTGRRFYYVQNAQYTTIQYKVFKKIEGRAQFTGVGFGADGGVYASNSNYSLERIVSINYVELEATPTPRPPTSVTTLTEQEPSKLIQLKTVQPRDNAGLVIRKIRKLQKKP